MPAHDLIQDMIERYQAHQLHAARSGRETMEALVQVGMESTGPDAEGLAADVGEAVDALLAVMPPYAPPVNVMHLVLSQLEKAVATRLTLPQAKQALEEAGTRFREWSAAARTRLVGHGSALIHDGQVVFTFTLSETMGHVFRHAAGEGKRFQVRVTESQPNRDGLATAKMLEEAGIPVEVGIDAGVGQIVPHADLVMVGAESIQFDGSAVCKVGTYLAASVAKANGIPVFVMVDHMKFDVSSCFGLGLPSEEINSSGASGSLPWTGHLFDVTPAEMITGVVTELGVLAPCACWIVMKRMPNSETLRRKLLSRADEERRHQLPESRG